MIHAGREVVDRYGIAQLHGLSEHRAKRQKPWDAKGHPASISSYPASRGGYPQLWDKEQAEAFAAGQPIPPVPTADDPQDLLDKFEAAKLADVPQSTWESAYQHNRVPADAEPYGVPHWHRNTVLAYKAERDQPRQKPHPGGRRVGTKPARQRRAVTREQQIRQLLADAETAGKPKPTGPEIAETLDISVHTAWRYLANINRPEGAPRRPRPPAVDRARIQQLVDEAAKAGRRRPTGREVAEALDINISTAWRHLAENSRDSNTS